MSDDDPDIAHSAEPQLPARHAFLRRMARIKTFLLPSQRR